MPNTAAAPAKYILFWFEDAAGTLLELNAQMFAKQALVREVLPEMVKDRSVAVDWRAYEAVSALLPGVRLFVSLEGAENGAVNRARDYACLNGDMCFHTTQDALHAADLDAECLNELVPQVLLIGSPVFVNSIKGRIAQGFRCIFGATPENAMPGTSVINRDDFALLTDERLLSPAGEERLQHWARINIRDAQV